MKLWCAIYSILSKCQECVIETVINELKNICHLDHTRHKKIDIFITNFIAAIIA